MDVSPYLARALDELVRQDLQSSRDWYFDLVLISTLLVFIGVVLEEAGIIAGPFSEPRLNLQNGIPIPSIA
jgi:hypothetical protein